MKMSGTSRRSNVATSPRRDVPTSRRWGQLLCRSTSGNVATSARDLPSIIKSKRGSESRYRETYGLGHGNLEQQRNRSRRRARDLYCFPFFWTIE